MIIKKLMLQSILVSIIVATAMPAQADVFSWFWNYFTARPIISTITTGVGFAGLAFLSSVVRQRNSNNPIKVNFNTKEGLISISNFKWNDITIKTEITEDNHYSIIFDRSSQMHNIAARAVLCNLILSHVPKGKKFNMEEMLCDIYGIYDLRSPMVRNKNITVAMPTITPINSRI